MSDNGFDRAPGAGRGRGGGAPLAPESGARLGSGGGGGGSSSFGAPEQLLKQGFARPQEPLRPPKTAPPGSNPASEQARAASLPEKKMSGSAVTKPQVVVAPVVMSKLSVNAPEFYPSGYTPNHPGPPGTSGRGRRDKGEAVAGKVGIHIDGRQQTISGAAENLEKKGEGENMLKL